MDHLADMTQDDWRERFPALNQFFGCYLHQDWPEEYGTVERAVDAFVKEEPIQAVRQASAELRQLRAAIDEGAASEALGALSCGFYPPGVGLTHLEWLDGVQIRLDLVDTGQA